MALTGEPGRPADKSGLSLVDLATGYAAALALMAGSGRAARRRRLRLRRSLFETAMQSRHVLGDLAPLARLRARADAELRPSLDRAVPELPDRDGWIVIACAKEKFFGLLCAELGLGWMIGDPRFATMAARHEHREACVRELSAVLLGEPSEVWLDRLRAAGVPCGPVNDMAGAVGDPQTLARELIAETEHPVLGTVRQIRSPLRVDGRVTELRMAPRRGEHTREVLVERCGYASADVDRLAAAGVFGDVEI